MKKLIFLLLFLSLTCNLYAQEVISEFDDKGLVILNEELRKINNAVAVLPPDTDIKAKVSSNDTTAGYLNGKLVAGTGITFTENNNGANETLTIASSLTQQLFTSSGTFTTPIGVTTVFVTMVSGGGGGAGDAYAGSTGTGGGGGGAFIFSFPVKVTALSNYSVSVGAKGVGSTGAVVGGSGGVSGFSGDLVTVSCNGGTGGNYTGGGTTALGGPGGTSSTQGSPVGSTGGAGGYGGGVSIAGGAGGPSGGDPFPTGAGGGSPWGQGGAGLAGANNDLNGNPGTGYGAGGGGARRFNAGGEMTGGDGTAGLVIVQW